MPKILFIISLGIVHISSIASYCLRNFGKYNLKYLMKLFYSFTINEETYSVIFYDTT